MEGGQLEECIERGKKRRKKKWAVSEQQDLNSQWGKVKLKRENRKLSSLPCGSLNGVKRRAVDITSNEQTEWSKRRKEERDVCFAVIPREL